MRDATVPGGSPRAPHRRQRPSPLSVRRAGPPSTGAATAAAVGRISAVAARVIAVGRLSRAPCCAHPSRHRNLTRRNLTRRAGSASMLALCQRVDDRGCARTGSHPDAGSDGDVLEFRVATRERRRADTGPWAFMGSCGGPCLRRSKTSFRSLQTMRCRGHPRRAGRSVRGPRVPREVAAETGCAASQRVEKEPRDRRQHLRPVKLRSLMIRAPQQNQTRVDPRASSASCIARLARSGTRPSRSPCMSR